MSSYHIKGTEFLTSKGWMSVESISEKDLVANVDKISGLITYRNPFRVIHNENSNLVKFSNTWVDGVVSCESDVLVDNRLVTAKSLVGTTIENTRFKLNAEHSGSGVCLSLLYLKLITWVIMDGTIVRSSERKTRVQFKLSKERKIECLEKLLTELSIPYTKRLCKKTGINKLQPYYIRIYGEYSLGIHTYLNNIKQIPKDWVNINKVELNAVLEAMLETDASRCGNKITWHSCSLNDVEVMQKACIVNGISFNIKEKDNASGFNNGRLQYVCRIDTNQDNLSRENVKVEKLEEKVDTYGVLTDGYVISRRNYKVWIT